MDDRLGVQDEALDAVAAACAAANEAVAPSVRATAPELGGVTNVGQRVSEFMTTLALSCSVLAAAAMHARYSALACRDGSDATDAQIAAALARREGVSSHD